MSRYCIEVCAEFSASHQLRLPGGGLEPLHGHNWRVAVTVCSHQLDEIETVMDFHILEAALAAVIQPWHNRHLNDVEPFSRTVNPSAERVAETIVQAISTLIPPPAELAEVRVTEAPNCAALWRR